MLSTKLEVSITYKLKHVFEMPLSHLNDQSFQTNFKHSITFTDKSRTPEQFIVRALRENLLASRFNHNVPDLYARSSENERELFTETAIWWTAQNDD